MLERAARDDQQFVDLERLLQVVQCAQLHCLDRAFHRRVRGHHQDLRALVLRRGSHILANQLQAAQLRHDVVDHQQVERPLGQQALRLPRAGRFHHAVTGVAQGSAQRLEDLVLVVDQKNRTAVCGHQASDLSLMESVMDVRVSASGRVMRDLGAASEFAVDRDRAAEPLDDVLRDREPEAGSAPLGREIRIEDPRDVRPLDPGAGIRHGHHNRPRRRDGSSG